MQRFTQLFLEIDATTSTNAKVAALRRYLRDESAANSVWALYLLLGKTRKRLITSRVLRDIFLQISDIPEWLFEDCYAQVGDSAEVISLLMQSHASLAPFEQTSQPESLPLHLWMEQIIPQVKQVESEAELKALVVSWWAALNPTGVFVLNKVLTGAFRMGLSDKLVIRAIAQEFDIPEPVMAHRLMGEFVPTVEFFESLTQIEAAEALSSPTRPYPFFLASPLEEDRFATEDFSRWWAEWKWDGIRAQIIRRAGQVFIWSRGEDLVTDQFPELAAYFLTLPDGLVFDGEILCWADGRPLSFNHLQKRLGRKRVTQKIMQENPVHFIAYDLLEHNSEDIREKELGDRRTLLESVLQAADPVFVTLSSIVQFTSLEELRSLRESSRERSAEGLVLKAVNSPYLVGRKRGYWWKYKVEPMTLDAVLIYAQAGSGKRANLFTDYTFALWHEGNLVSFAKAYSGLDNAEIDALDKWIRKHTIEKFGPVRSVEPIQVFEIGFEGILRSTRHKSGIAVRFPRILRWRTDKPAAEADTLEAAFKLLDIEGERIKDEG
ncbi:MAG: ATP-dependent DNA ligase [Elainellaceae cyanobacterium]